MHILHVCCFFFYLLVSKECLSCLMDVSYHWEASGPNMFIYRTLCMVLARPLGNTCALLLTNWDPGYIIILPLLHLLNHVSEASRVFCRKCKQLQRSSDLWLSRCVRLLLLSVSYRLQESSSQVTCQWRRAALCVQNDGVAAVSQFP